MMNFEAVEFEKAALVVYSSFAFLSQCGRGLEG
jgi:hypothetical protein